MVRKSNRSFGTTDREVGGRTVPKSATAEEILHQTVADLANAIINCLSVARGDAGLRWTAVAIAITLVL